MKEAELVALLEKQIAVEKEQSRALDETMSKTKSSVVRHMLNTVRLDTLRHIDLCQGIIDFVSEKDVSAPTSQEVLERIEEHMKAEDAMLTQLKATMKTTDNRMVRAILRQLTVDETQHHRLFEKIKSETLTISKDAYIDSLLYPLAYTLPRGISPYYETVED